MVGCSDGSQHRPVDEVVAPVKPTLTGHAVAVAYVAVATKAQRDDAKLSGPKPYPCGCGCRFSVRDDRPCTVRRCCRTVVARLTGAGPSRIGSILYTLPADELLQASPSLLTKWVSAMNIRYSLSVVAVTTLLISGAVTTAQAATGDSDHDGISNRFERTHGMNPNRAADAKADFDKDGLNNLREYRVGSALRDEDTDNDGDDDGDEVRDGFPSTDVDDPDTDNDGTLDGDEDANHDGIDNEDADDATETCVADDDDRDSDNIADEDENDFGFKVADSDSDNDGVEDGNEDADNDGVNDEDADDSASDDCDVDDEDVDDEVDSLLS